MNQTFDLRRFGLLLKLHLSEHLRTYLMGMVVLLGALALLFLMINTLRLANYYVYIYGLHSQVFVFAFAVSGCWFASESFKSLQNPVHGIPYLMIPASTLEKFLVTLVLILLFIPVYTAIFYLVEGFFFAVVNANLPANSEHYSLMNPYQPEVRNAYFPLFLALLAYSFFFLGALYFAKAPFVKTGLVAFLLCVAIILIHQNVLTWLLPERSIIGGGIPFVRFVINTGQTTNHQFYDVRLQGVAYQAVMLFWYFMLPALCAITYVRFREKQL